MVGQEGGAYIGSRERRDGMKVVTSGKHRRRNVGTFGSFNGTLWGNLPPAASTSAGAAVTAAVATVAVLGAAVTAPATSAAVTAVTTASATLPVVTVTSAAATASATTATASAVPTATKAVLVSNGVEPCRNVLVGLTEELDEVPDDVAVTTVEKRSRDTDVTSTTSTTDTVYIVVDVRREVVVDDMRDVGDIKTASSDSSRNKDGGAASPEGLEGRLTLALSTVAVDGGSREVVAQEEVGEHVGHALGLDEDEGQTSAVSLKNVKEDRALVVVLDVLDPLSDVLRGRADTTDRQENVILHEVPGKHLNVTGKSRREHERLAVLDTRHVLALDNPADLRLETHVKHAVGLIENEVPNVGKADTTTLDKVHETTGGGAKEVAAALNLPQLLVDVSTAIDHGRADPGTVAELAGLFVDLAHELTSGRENKGGGVGLAGATVTHTSLRIGGRRAGTVGEGSGKDGEQETACFPRTRL